MGPTTQQIRFRRCHWGKADSYPSPKLRLPRRVLAHFAGRDAGRVAACGGECASARPDWVRRYIGVSIGVLLTFGSAQKDKQSSA
jgi:hypothetical protein